MLVPPWKPGGTTNAVSSDAVENEVGMAPSGLLLTV